MIEFDHWFFDTLQNDDDEERRASRAHHVSLLQISTTNSAIAESDELKNCLKKFVDNVSIQFCYLFFTFLKDIVFPY